MDPLTTFGLVCNLLTVVDAAVKCGKTIVELYESTSGYTRETEGLRKASRDLKAIERDLKASQSQVPPTGSGERMQDAAADCARIACRINEILVSCAPQRPRFWRFAINAYLKFAVRKSEILRLRDELETSSTKLALLVATTTLSDVSEIRFRLQQTHTDHQVSVEKLDALKVHLDRVTAPDEILEAIKAINTTSHEAMEIITQDLLVQSIRSRYPSARARFESVSRAESGTFSWILEDPDRLLEMEPELHISFTEWLASGLGVFHIAGKPGAGKSTLMKLLMTHKETKRLLEEWAGEKDLLFANFFFWRLGDAGQKTWDGMVGSLLYDIVRQVPSVAKLLFTNHWQREKMQLCLRANYVIDLSQAEILEAFEKLISDSEVHEKYRICLGIDGLDEFDELTISHWDLAQRLKNWLERSSENIKLCVSSREYPDIEQVFSKHQRIHLHRLTAKDIMQLSMDRLNGNPLFRSLSERSAEDSQIIFWRITRESEGIFLWVVLLLKLIEEELAIRTETISMRRVHDIIESAPKELEEFIVHILHTIPTHYRGNAIMVLAMALRMNCLLIQPESKRRNWVYHHSLRNASYEVHFLSVLGVSLHFEPLDKIDSLDDQSYIDCRRRDAVKLLNCWCRGLLTVGTAVLGFSHRSIPELLQKIFRNQEAQDITDEMVVEGILKVFLAETKVPGRVLNFNLWDRTGFIVSRNFFHECPARTFHILHSIDKANNRKIFGPHYSDNSWIRERYMDRISERSMDPLELDEYTDKASLLNASARLGRYQYCLWSVENQLRFPDDRHRMETMLAFATCAAMEDSGDLSGFKRILDSCVRKWETSSHEKMQAFPWNVTWLDFVNYFLIDRLPKLAGHAVGWSVFEYWLELGLNPTFVIFLSRPWNGSNDISMDLITRPPELQQLREIDYEKRLKPRMDCHTSIQLHQSLWEFAYAEQRRGFLTVRDLVVFHNPANTARLLELIDKNVGDNPTEVAEFSMVTASAEDDICKTEGLIEDRTKSDDQKTQIPAVAEAGIPPLLRVFRETSRRVGYLAILGLFFASVALLRSIF
ncbi:hypothetical protein BKA56DRAFT_672555 [Ilyonectria sp. MPI-CAGE-AT-0026]|nr:hypothetical protein BKA56DRAFT_672555 [Ilyonectria sp. MPI-CAGE-AT-0026]